MTRGDLVTARLDAAATDHPRVRHEPFGQAPDGSPVERWTLAGVGGLEVQAMTYGGIITSIRAPDRDGRMDDIVLGHDDVDGYVRSASYFGAVVGRCANRIARGRFTLEGVTRVLDVNNGPNHLHGGARGLDKVMWQAAETRCADGIGIVLTHVSADGDGGYPGRLAIRVSYTLTEASELIVDYHATTDRPTPVNLTQHSYFNLAGAGRGDILGHVLQLHADRYTPVDATLIPTGELASVAGTPFDFREPTRIGARIGAADAQLQHAGGYDHNWVLSHRGEGVAHAARLIEPGSGRVLDVHTTEPGIQFYSGNFLDGTARGKDGRAYAHRTGLCLETQHFPDSPNQPHFPSVILRPGAEHRSRTVFAFGVLGVAQA